MQISQGPMSKLKQWWPRPMTPYGMTPTAQSSLVVLKAVKLTVIMRQPGSQTEGTLDDLFVWWQGTIVSGGTSPYDDRDQFSQVGWIYNDGLFMLKRCNSIANALELHLFSIKPSTYAPLFSKKTPSYGYRDPHYKVKTVRLPSQFYNGNPYTKKTRYS